MRNFLFVFLIVLGSSCFSQKEKTDSIVKALEIAIADTNKVKLLNRFCVSLLREGKNDTALFYANSAKTLAQKLNHKKGVAESLGSIGASYYYLGNYPEAKKYFLEAFNMREYLSDAGVASCYLNLGGIYYFEGNYPEALTNFHTALLYYKKLKNINAMAFCYNNIGAMYQAIEKYDEALKNYVLALEMHKKTGDQKSIVDLNNNIAYLYTEQKKYEKAISLIDSIIYMCNKIDYKVGLSTAISNLALSLFHTEKYNEALLKYEAAYDLKHNLGDISGEAVALLGLAQSFKKLHKLKEAEIKIKQALIITKEIGYLAVESLCYKLLAEVYEEMGKDSDAYKAYKSYIMERDTLLSQESNNKIVRLEVEHEYNKKEAVLKERQEKDSAIAEAGNSKQRLMIIGISGLGIVILLIALFILSQKKFKTEQRGLLLEQKLLRSQMNPHFIFNSLTAIESFIYKNEPKIAGKYLSGFARLMRLILENSREEHVTLEKEIQGLKYYLNLQKLRYDDTFDYVLEVDENIDPALISVPPMLAQPFIENSIEHGLKDLPHIGKIKVHFIIRNNELQFSIEDNGLGFEQTLQMKNKEKTHRSLATTITLERLKILNKKKHQKIQWLAEDLKDPLNKTVGARVIFSIPVQNI